MKAGLVFIFLISTVFFGYPSLAQISPGELAEVHAYLEGISNCTKCHTLGAKVSNQKCLDCHTEIKVRIDFQKGYHSSPDIRGKECVSCHNDHHGRKFEIIRFDQSTFDHNLAGYTLLGAHSKKGCKDCHKREFITDQKIKDKKFTYLGLATTCISCHSDYHQNTLSQNCADCHSLEVFKPASKFDHSKAKFQLAGKHLSVDCIKCHKTETRNGQNFQRFTGISFANCTSCHKDVHDNKFGQDCRQCHTEESFHLVKGMNDFDHNETNFKLENKHLGVKCTSCHKGSFTENLKHDRCTDCHTDYHKNEFARDGVSPDCSQCHSTQGFDWFSYTIQQHNEGKFQVDGAHLATPCFACHKKAERWSFRQIGERCSDCHKDVHESYLDKKYYPEANCRSCHITTGWSDVQFDHLKTGFELAGAHRSQSCRKCHFPEASNGSEQQQFSGLSSSCINCHADIHIGQFQKDDGITNCVDCHGFDSWKAGKFDHNNTSFKLDGKHKDVACTKCHKEAEADQKRYILYKLKDFRCESCHLQ